MAHADEGSVSLAAGVESLKSTSREVAPVLYMTEEVSRVGRSTSRGAHGKLCSRTDLEAGQLEGGSGGREPLLRPTLASESCHLHPGGLVEQAAERLSVHHRDEHRLSAYCVPYTRYMIASSSSSQSSCMGQSHCQFHFSRRN